VFISVLLCKEVFETQNIDLSSNYQDICSALKAFEAVNQPNISLFDFISYFNSLSYKFTLNSGSAWIL